MPEEVANTNVETSQTAPETAPAETKPAEQAPTAEPVEKPQEEPKTAEEKPAEKAEEKPAEPELTVDSYKDVGMEDFEEQFRFSEDNLKSFKEMGAANKISPDNMKKFATWTMGQIKQQQQEYAKVQESWRKANQEKYGDNLKNVKTNVGRVLTAYDKSGEFAKLLQFAGAEDNPATLEFLSAIGDVLLEKGSVNPNATIQGKEMTLEDMYKPKN